MRDGQSLLLALLKRGDAPAPADLARITADEWRAVLAAAPRHLHPYLAHRIAVRGATRHLPHDVGHALATACRSAALVNLQRQALLRRITNALDGAGVPFLVLKGAVLAHVAYPEPSLRPGTDLDLWTPPDSLESATRALLEAGLAHCERMEARTDAADDLRSGATRILEAPGLRLAVDLHSSLPSMASAGPGWELRAWSRAERRDLGGIMAPVLAREDMLLHLAIHGSAYHGFGFGLRPLLDVALWIDRWSASWSWPEMQREWEREGVGVWMRLTLALSAELLGAPVPPAVYRGEADAEVPDDLLALAREQVLEAEQALPPALSRLATLGDRAARRRWLVHRLTRWYWGGPGQDDTPWLDRVRGALRRVGHDVRHKLPPYVRGLVSGSLRGASLRRRAELAVARQRMVERVREQESRRRAMREV